MLILLKRENGLREQGFRDEVVTGIENMNGDEVKNGCYPTVDDARRDKGDRWSGFRYTL